MPFNLNAVHAVGDVAAAALRRQPHLPTRTAGQIDPEDPLARGERSVSLDVRRPEERDHRRAHRRRQVHRTGVAGHQHVETAEQRRERRQIERAGGVDDARRAHRGTNLLHHRTVRLRAGQDNRRALLRRETSRDLSESIEVPLFGFASAACVHADNRARRAAEDGLRACNGVGRRHETRTRRAIGRIDGLAPGRPGNEMPRVVGDVTAWRIRRPAGQERAAAARPVPETAWRAGKPGQQIAADVRLEVDDEIVPGLAPRARLQEEGPP